MSRIPPERSPTTRDDYLDRQYKLSQLSPIDRIIYNNWDWFLEAATPKGQQPDQSGAVIDLPGVLADTLEQSIASLYLNGLTAGQIAESICRSTKTVRNIISGIRNRHPDLLPYRIHPHKKSG